MSHKEDMQNWQAEWMKVSEEFQKPQFIVDALKEQEFYRNMRESKMANDPAKVSDSLDTSFTVNPVHFASLGKDQEVKVTPDFSDGDVLRELNAIKLSLYELESKVNAAYGHGEEKQENKLRKELETVRSKFDELSNKLTPNPINDRS